MPRTLLDVMVPMRDGIRLAANVYLPDGPGPFPVLLNRTPYIKDSSLRVERAKAYLTGGYAVVHMDVRGRGNSEGKYRPYFQEIEDGYDCIEWCGKQDWSDGNVGTYGGSYEGWTQIFPTRLRSQHHKAAFLMCTPSMHPFHEGQHHSGVPSPISTMLALYTTGKTLKEQVKDLAWEDALRVRPLRALLPSLGCSDTSRQAHMDHPHFDSYYEPLWHERVLDETTVPCYHVSGWFDDDLKGTLENFPWLAHRHPDPKVQRSQKLLIGPWPHRLSTDTSKLGDFDYGAHSIVPLQKEAMRWFDRWLKGKANGIDEEPRCRLFLMGENRWLETDDFPVGAGRRDEWLLAASGPSNSLLGKGELTKRHGDVPSSTYTYDPEKPAPAPFWKENFQMGANEDLRSIQRRDDVLVFTSEPMETPLNVLGMVEAELHVATTAVDTDFVVRLSDVHPSGYAMRLCHGVVRLRFRDGYEKPKLVTPGETVKVSVDMWATGHQFKAGHKLRLEVTSSAYPVLAPNYNTGENPWDEVTPIIAEQTVRHAPAHPSRLILPVVDEPTYCESWTDSRWR